MKFFIAILVVLLSLNLYSQADLTIDIYLHDNFIPPYGGDATISFGLDSTATDGIDPQLSEWQYPPDVCPSWWPFFCAKFILPPFNGNLDSPKDFRFGLLPFTGQKTHKIYIVSADTLVTMEYNFPPGVIVNLSDILGGIVFIATLVDSGQVLIPYNSVIASGLWMYVDYNDVIPVELISFSGEQINNVVNLYWETAIEYNNSGFEILRKAQNDNEWKTIGFVPGFGTTTEPKSYSFIDENVTSETYKYRLKQIDFDGTFTYSNEIEVEVDFTPKEFVLYQNYPNPFNPKTVISYQLPVTGNVTLKVYDILGNEVATLVNEEKQPGVYEVEFGSHGSHSGEVRNLTSGIYFYRLKAGPFTQTKKMILIK